MSLDTREEFGLMTEKMLKLLPSVMSHSSSIGDDVEMAVDEFVQSGDKNTTIFVLKKFVDLSTELIGALREQKTKAKAAEKMNHSVGTKVGIGATDSMAAMAKKLKEVRTTLAISSAALSKVTVLNAELQNESNAFVAKISEIVGENEP
jgi:soluble P-type ATPase